MNKSNKEIVFKDKNIEISFSEKKENKDDNLNKKKENLIGDIKNDVEKIKDINNKDNNNDNNKNNNKDNNKNNNKDNSKDSNNYEINKDLSKNLKKEENSNKKESDSKEEISEEEKSEEIEKEEKINNEEKNKEEEIIKNEKIQQEIQDLSGFEIQSEQIKELKGIFSQNIRNSNFSEELQRNILFLLNKFKENIGKEEYLDKNISSIFVFLNCILPNELNRIEEIITSPDFIVKNIYNNTESFLNENTALELENTLITRKNDLENEIEREIILINSLENINKSIEINKGNIIKEEDKISIFEIEFKLLSEKFSDICKNVENLKKEINSIKDSQETFETLNEEIRNLIEIKKKENLDLVNENNCKAFKINEISSNVKIITKENLIKEKNLDCYYKNEKILKKIKFFENRLRFYQDYDFDFCEKKEEENLSLIYKNIVENKEKNYKKLNKTDAKLFNFIDKKEKVFYIIYFFN